MQMQSDHVSRARPLQINSSLSRRITMDNKNIIRFILTFFLGFIGSIIINHTELKPEGFTSRSWAYFLLTYITMGIYPLVASICNLFFDPSKDKNIGYKKD